MVRLAAVQVEPVRPAPEVAPSVLDMVGRIVFLCAHSPIHRRYSVGRIEETFFPALSLGQYRCYERDGRPAGFVSWGWFSDEVSERYGGGCYTPPSEEWFRGPHLWFSQLIVPFGDLRLVMRHLTGSLFPEHRARSLRRDAEGNLVKVASYHGVRYAETVRRARRRSVEATRARSLAPA